MTQPPPAEIGMPIDDVDTPALVIELNPFERNLKFMAERASAFGVALRPHAKMHKSPTIAALQGELDAVGQCCQKLSEAEVLVDGGIDDVFVSNQVVGYRKLERLAALARRAKVSVCVDDSTNLADLAAAAIAHDTYIDVLVEIDVGSGRCGFRHSQDAVTLAREIDSADHLTFAGLQAYHGGAQHMRSVVQPSSRLRRKCTRRRRRCQEPVCRARRLPAPARAVSTSRRKQASGTSSSAAPMLSWMPTTLGIF
jgi:3-hydroxy-D-aspartate aldolase